MHQDVLFNKSPVNEPLGFVQSFDIMNNAAVTNLLDT